MKKYYIILITILFLSSCFFNNTNDNLDSDLDGDIDIETSTGIETNIDAEILIEEQKLKDLEKINENEIDELINSIIE